MTLFDFFPRDFATKGSAELNALFERVVAHITPIRVTPVRTNNTSQYYYFDLRSKNRAIVTHGYAPPSKKRIYTIEELTEYVNQRFLQPEPAEPVANHPMDVEEIAHSIRTTPFSYGFNPLPPVQEDEVVQEETPDEPKIDIQNKKIWVGDFSDEELYQLFQELCNLGIENSDDYDVNGYRNGKKPTVYAIPGYCNDLLWGEITKVDFDTQYTDYETLDGKVLLKNRKVLYYEVIKEFPSDHYGLHDRISSENDSRFFNEVCPKYSEFFKPVYDQTRVLLVGEANKQVTITPGQIIAERLEVPVEDLEKLVPKGEDQLVGPWVAQVYYNIGCWTGITLKEIQRIIATYNQVTNN